MWEGSKRCRDCAARARKGQTTRTTQDAVHTVARRESIITFRRVEDGRVRTLQCFGAGLKLQIADGKARLGEGDWEVECRSTPLTILQDIRGTQNSLRRVDQLKRAVAG